MGAGFSFDTRQPLMANWTQAARDWAKRGVTDPKFAAKLKARRDEVSDASLTAGGLQQITSASKNGVSTTINGGTSLGPQEEMAALQLACEWVAAGVVPSRTRGYGRF
jgi:hypothetical protein